MSFWYVFTLKFIHTCDDLISYRFNYVCKLYTILKLKRMNNKFFLWILLILSGGFSLDFGPIYNNQLIDWNEWNVFKSKEIYSIHLNVYSLLPKVGEIRYIAEHLNAAVIGITKFKLGESISQSEIQMVYYNLLRCNRKRKGARVACYIRSDIGHVQKYFFPNIIENIFFEILLPTNHTCNCWNNV